MTVYSTLLARGAQVGGTYGTVYTVPSGVTVVFRDVILEQATAGVATVIVSAGGFSLVSIVGVSVQYQTYHESLRAVLAPGDDVIVDAVSADWTYWLSGYVLTP